MAKTQALSAASGTVQEERKPTFQDWSRFVSFQPPVYFRPQSLDELKSFVTGMLQGTPQIRNLRVLGGMHSCSDVCVSEMVVDVSDLPRTIEFNADYTVVTASANWHLHDFLLALSEHGKALNATGGMDRQTLAGLISTDTAPATSRFRYMTWSSGRNTSR
jgi:FAD/FMN-containing dehydrogenase